MGVYDDEDAVRADVDMEEEEEEIGQVRTMRRRRCALTDGRHFDGWVDEDGDLQPTTTLGCDRSHFIFIRVRRVACRCGDGWIEGNERGMTVVRMWTDAWEAERGGDGMGWRRRSLARSRSDRETDEGEKCIFVQT